MVEIFKTNIINKEQIKRVVNKIQEKFPYYKIDFDIDDCDKILRIENTNNKIDSEQIINVVSGLGFFIDILADTHNQE
ncbi:hypothetical protein SLW70_10455 [Flavobacterium sp. NG2]|uniref:hypothetical protein n=1 Tax=Flavobacterium sp. NG2 TaxID=3097547 RepID=UPI002A830353|nr:hypothetical protein [Flavobacterium sp. NG2]WPR70363.1 hypothetical protein SLW70_10455 [Flavobacterium sp. NG2]